MDDTERRKKAWDKAIHSEGTRAVFARRAAKLKSLTQARDFVGLAVPILLAYLYGSDVFEPLKPYRTYVIGLLGALAVLQGLMVAWSLLSHWDEELANDVTAASENYLLKEAWKKIGEGDAKDLALEYELLSGRESIRAAYDAKAGITAKEKQFGMRAGLIEFQRACMCKELPTTQTPPLFPEKKCSICGGN